MSSIGESTWVAGADPEFCTPCTAGPAQQPCTGSAPTSTEKQGRAARITALVLHNGDAADADFGKIFEQRVADAALLRKEDDDQCR